MPDTTSKGFPYPEGPDAVDVAGDIQALAEAVDDMPGVQSYTGAEIAALAVGEKWAGRIVWNSTTGKLQVSNGSTFSDVDTSLALSSTTPAALGVAAVGNGTTAARDNHVHAMPSASDVGAVANSLIGANNGVASLDSTGQVPASQLGNASGGATGGGTDEVFYENQQTVTTNYTITSSRNALSAGPLTIGTGVTVTVPSGSVWAIV